MQVALRQYTSTYADTSFIKLISPPFKNMTERVCALAFQDYEERLSAEESHCDVMDAAKRKAEEACELLREEVETLEMNLQKLTEERKAKDAQIKVLLCCKWLLNKS